MMVNVVCALNKRTDYLDDPVEVIFFKLKGDMIS